MRWRHTGKRRHIISFPCRHFRRRIFLVASRVPRFDRDVLRREGIGKRSPRSEILRRSTRIERFRCSESASGRSSKTVYICFELWRHSYELRGTKWFCEQQWIRHNSVGARKFQNTIFKHRWRHSLTFYIWYLRRFQLLTTHKNWV